ncbi:Thioesterase/thiol ester dehydrase-isomerase [Athelia psychrophila]|uniref:Thioesterase/thiol ester dehydrase-isomerase n=1 Tax=Athelia psychrophila TaxID=1759441 RepID=A0A166IHT7_9AGAM|nr:Thioesterase/thiol ester dehydrase-isomerase [Fibularhizoctonia sp. CBS 109695]
MPLRTPMLWSESILASLSPTPPHTAPPPPHSDSLPARHGYDSYSELVLPFKSNTALLDSYTNASGGIRVGKLMEHLDSLAGSIAYKHLLGPTVSALGPVHERGFYLVTASVDRLDMLAPLYPVRDIRLSGQVIHTGRSSIEVAVRMEALGADHAEGEKTIMLGRFSMVCRDATTHTARAVNPLLISTPEEDALEVMGARLKQHRQDRSRRALNRVPPTSTEAADLHAFYLAHGQPGPHGDGERVWMADTKLETTMLMFPQERNVHQKIFGGYLMRLAHELGYAGAALFARAPVRFLALDGISFTRPVPIGSVLRLSGRVLHTHGKLVHVAVRAYTADIATGAEEVTNDFRFTFARPLDPLNANSREVVPKTYTEAMLWLEGRRALEMGMEIRGLRGGGRE